MKVKLKAILAMLGALNGLFSFGVAEAHHSVAAVDLSKTDVTSGTVKAFEWTNPHAWIWVTVNDPKSGMQDLGFECASLTMLRRGGWSRDLLKTGDKVTVKYHPMKDGKLGGQFVELQFEDGRTLSMMGPAPANK